MLFKTSTTFDSKKALRLVSRTFALSIEQLPGLLRDAITLAYLMFRVSDFLEDNEIMTPGRKIELLNLWAGILSGENGPEKLAEHLSDIDPSDPEAVVAQQAEEVLERLRSMPEAIQQIIIREVHE